LDNIKTFPDGSGDPEPEDTKVQFRTLGLADGQATLARDLGEKAKTKSYTQEDDGTFTYKVEYTLKQPYPILGAVMSFGSGTSENATYAVTDKLDIDDGSGMVENFAKLSWIKPSNETVQAQDGLVNMFQKIDNPPNSQKVVMTIKGDENLGR
jgi:hypothetical protein